MIFYIYHTPKSYYYSRIILNQKSKLNSKINKILEKNITKVVENIITTFELFVRLIRVYIQIFLEFIRLYSFRFKHLKKSI